MTWRAIVRHNGKCKIVRQEVRIIAEHPMSPSCKAQRLPKYYAKNFSWRGARARGQCLCNVTRNLRQYNSCHSQENPRHDEIGSKTTTFLIKTPARCKEGYLLSRYAEISVAKSGARIEVSK